MPSAIGELVERAKATEAARAPGKCGLADAVARYLFKLMAYKDEYEVRGFTPTVRSLSRLNRSSTETIFASNFYLAPPLLAAVVLVECLTGSPPYLGGPAVLRDQHLRAPLPGPELLPEVAPLVRFGMAKSPHQRYLRAWDFAEAVEGAGRTVGGPHWERRGRRRLATAVALELAQLPGHDASEPHRGLIGRARFRRRSRTQP